MSNGVEIRMPFLDHRIVAFAFSLPWTSKLRNGYSKAVIRKAMSPYLSKSIAFRKSKIGFNSPVVDWMKGPLKTSFLDIIHSESFSHCNLIEPQIVSKRIHSTIENPNNTFMDCEKAWTMLTPYLWAQAFLKRSDLSI